MIVKARHILLLSVLVLFGACNEPAKDPNAETMSSGSVVVWCDNEMLGLLKPQIDLFSSKNPAAKIELRSVSSREAMEALLARKARIVLLSRGYLQDEDSLMKAYKVEPHRTLHIATDALVFFASKNLPTDTLSVEALREYFQNAVPLSRAVKGLNGETSVAVPSVLSGVVGNIMIQCCGGRALNAKAKIQVCGSTDSVKMFVRSHPNMIGAGMLSDLIRDTAEFKLLGIKYTDSDGNRRSMKVEQSAVYREMYPYPAKIQAYLLENLRNLPMGLAAFLAYEPEPQKYFLQKGIVPAYARIQLYEE